MEREATDRGLRRRIILIVDDDPDTRRILRDLLEYLGFSVEEAPDGTAALELAVREQPRLVIENFPTPLDERHTLTEALRSRPGTATVPILNITSRVTIRELSAAQNAGVTRSLAKPVDLQTIADAVRGLVSDAASRESRSPPDAPAFTTDPPELR